VSFTLVLRQSARTKFDPAERLLSPAERLLSPADLERAWSGFSMLKPSCAALCAGDRGVAASE